MADDVTLDDTLDAAVALDTIAEIYDAVGDPQRWRALLDRLSDGVSPELQAHLENARRVHERHVDLSTAIAAFAHVHAQLGIAVLLADEHGSVAWHNRAAARLLEEDDAIFQIVDGALVVGDPDGQAALANAIAGAESDSSGTRLPFVLISRPARRPLAVFALRAPSSAAGFVEECRRVLLLAVDPDAVNPPASQTIRELFGFTAREAECAVLLMEGRSLDEAARMMGVRRSTARTFLARMTAKTDSHSQAEFVGRLLAIPHGHELA